MREESLSRRIPPNCRPRLVRTVKLDVDRGRGEPILRHRDRVLRTNRIGAAVIELCDGWRRVEDIVWEVGQWYGLPIDELGDDVREFLARLKRSRLLTW